VAGLAAALITAAPASALSPIGWSAPAAFDPAAPTGVACSSESLCVAVDAAGSVFATGNPNAATPAWNVVARDANPLSAVACAPSLCVAVDDHGGALLSNNPVASGTWSSIALDPGHALQGISCPSSAQCVAVDETGALASASPASGGWPRVSIDPEHHLRAVSCGAPSVCTAVDDAGQAISSTNPLAGSWQPARRVDAVAGFSAVSCRPDGACVAVDELGDADASQDPAASNATWSLTPVDAGRLSGVSCASSGLCVAVDERGASSASDNPTSPVPQWVESAPDAGYALSGVACRPAGFCVAVDRAGRSLLARVRAPAAVTTTPGEVTVSTAALAGVVNPNDALLSACWFEYGTSLPYTGAVPCSALPAPAGGDQAVVAQVGGLAPNTTYHYRIVATSGVGTGVGADVTFTTATSSQVPLVFAHPSISGTPAVGQRLSCHPGTPSGAVAQLTYAWLRDLIPIANASSSTYTVHGIDTGHHLQCQVTATNGGGSSTARSPFVTVPVQGIPASVGETSVGRARYRAGRVGVPVGCSPHAFAGCRVTLRLVLPATRGRHAVTLAGLRAHLARGEHRTLTLKLGAGARRLVARRHHLTATLSARGTLIGVIEASLGAQRVTLGAGSRAAKSDAHR
jgi:hypothetical protein